MVALFRLRPWSGARVASQQNLKLRPAIVSIARVGRAPLGTICLASLANRFEFPITFIFGEKHLQHALSTYLATICESAAASAAQPLARGEAGGRIEMGNSAC